MPRKRKQGPTVRCQRCHKKLPAPEQPDECQTSDLMTGTSYQRCVRCGCETMVSPYGYADRDTGVSFDDPRYVGSKHSSFRTC